ncbi:MAG: threonine/serine exporter family protein [Clostridiales Family XIII bacterium]|jgi:uncharacterized membrane protein YjjP (DUF1212 family)|nr:threonine/serine exporter family protein [Clostridiales Family XIII bacterium]
MINSKQKKVMILALFAGELMMRSGAEVNRIEDTITRICKACKIDYVECFATTTGIFLSLDSGDADADTHTFIKRIHSTSIDLDTISELNSFSREFTTTDLSIEDGFEQLKKIKRKPKYSLLMRLLGAILVGAFFCPIYGGSVFDMMVAGAISGTSYLLSNAIARLRLASFIGILICCVAAIGLTLLATTMGLTGSVSPVIVSATTIFLPGVALTNAARDLLSGDMLAGVSRFAEAILIAVCIAGGVGLGLHIWHLVGGTIAPDNLAAFPLPLFMLFGFLATIGFGLIFNAPQNRLVPISIIGGIGMVILDYMLPVYGMVASCFVGTVAVTLCAELSARIFKGPTTIFIIPGILSFVPGAPLYRTMSNFIDGEFDKAVSQGTEALLVAGSMALAIVLVSAFVRLTVAIVRRVRNIRQKL